jgi:hypothetical protein
MFTQLELVLSLLGGLSDRELDQVRCRIRQCDLDPCIKHGHKYRVAGQVMRWFLPPQQRLVCSQCGKVIVV